jgi:hypothetical protein
MPNSSAKRLIYTFIAHFLVKFPTRNVSIMMLRVYKFHENRRREDVASVIGVNETLYIHARTVKPYDIFKGKNALIKSICYVTNSIILSVVPHTVWHNSVRRMAGESIGSLHNLISVPARAN